MSGPTATVMPVTTTLTTRPSPVDVPARFPMLAAFARQATRLHPRSGDPTGRDSSMGGPLLWPADEPWPTCMSDFCCADDGTRRAQTDDPAPLVPVLQLFAQDVPGLPFPDGADLLQVLWCPFFHDESEPWPLLRWRCEADLDGASALRPAAHPQALRESVPSPCVLSPEVVTEYPVADLPQELASGVYELAKAVEAETGWNLFEHLSVAPGTKVGGYPSWVQGADWPVCLCGAVMAHLVTIASWEYDGAFCRRWIPVEEQSGYDLDAPIMELFAQNPQIRQAHGLMLGDVGNYHLFVCTECPERPSEHRWACS